MSLPSQKIKAFSIALVAGALIYFGVMRLGPVGSAAIGKDGGSRVPGLSHPPIRDIDSGLDDLSTLKQQLEKSPTHTPILLRMAQLARENGSLAEAAEHLRRAIEIEPANAAARLELGRVLYETGDLAGAVRETEQILKTDPAYVDALYNLGAIYANSSQPAIAEDYWTRAVAASPNSQSGRNAKRGLGLLRQDPMGQTPAAPESGEIPDIPEHRNVRRAQQGELEGIGEILRDFARRRPAGQ